LNTQEIPVSFFNSLLRTGRRAVKAAYILVLFLTGTLWWARRRVGELGVVVITLHRVLPDLEYESAQLQAGMAVRAGTFQRFLEYLKSNCECVLPGDVTFAATPVNSSRRPRLALTFDDGWKDNFETAFPISRKHGALFTIFICPDMINRRDGFWTETVGELWAAAQQAGKLDLVRTLCGPQAGASLACLVESVKHIGAGDREAFIAKMRGALQPYARPADNPKELLLTWHDIKEMSAAGISFGSHTNTHAILTDIPGSEAAQELTGSKKAIEAELQVCSTFAYPNGDWSPQIRDLVAQSGYQAAFINAPGIWQAHSNRFSIPRINLWEGSLVGFNGRYSRLALEYAIFWKAYRASAR
jgi:peptidoglycan/xylan/chitin deacetylase (PgdA/CDA1 family)